MQLAHPKVAQPKPGAFDLKSAMETLTVQHGCQTVHWKASARSNGWLSSVCCTSHQLDECNLDTSSGFKNASGPVGISQKKGHPRPQVINPTPSRRVRDWVDSSLKLKAFFWWVWMEGHSPELSSYSQWETYISSLLHSCKLGRFICQYHYKNFE